MDLFGEPLATDQPAVEISNRPTTEISPSSSASAPAEPVIPAGAAPNASNDRPKAESDQQPEAEPVAAAEGGRDSTPVSIPELPVIEGLDTADGLARAEGNPRLYRKALRHFAEQMKGIPEKIRDVLVQGDTEAAKRWLQVLKTSASDIGAVVVDGAVAALARAIDGAGDPSEIESVWAELEQAVGALAADLDNEFKPQEAKAAPARAWPAPPPVNPPQLRKAMNQILPLFTGQDPGAKDCLKANRAMFRSAFTPEAFVEFEQCVKSGEFSAALEHLKKAGKKHGVSV
jgi:two-component system sensor histidine kinase/response regulator